MKIIFGKKEYEIEEEELSRLITEEYKRIIQEEKKQGIISLDYGLFRVLNRLNKGSNIIPNCMACGSFEDYSVRCKYRSHVGIIQDNGNIKGLCKREDIPIKNLIEKGDLDKYKV